MKNSSKFQYLVYSKLSTFQKNMYYPNCRSFLCKLNREYPFFEQWFNGLFVRVPELRLDREILLCVDNCKIVGIAILKKNAEEKKICTLRVEKQYQKMSIGKTLMEMSFEWLETDKPLVTVQKSRSKEFEKLFKYYDFQLDDEKRGYYKPFSTELIYNGELPGKHIWLNRIEIIDISDILYEFIGKGIFKYNIVVWQRAYSV